MESETGAIQKKICMVGAYAVGKTSLVRRFVESIFDERYKTTIGVKIDRKRVVVREQQVNLVVWDLAGDDDLAQLRLSHLRGAAGYILVADGCRTATLDRAASLHESVQKALGQVPFVLAVNKADLWEEWQTDSKAFRHFSQFGWTIVQTSAKTGQGVEELFVTLAAKMLEKSHERASDGR